MIPEREQLSEFSGHAGRHATISGNCSAVNQSLFSTSCKVSFSLMKRKEEENIHC